MFGSLMTYPATLQHDLLIGMWLYFKTLKPTYFLSNKLLEMMSCKPGIKKYNLNITNNFILQSLIS